MNAFIRAFVSPGIKSRKTRKACAYQEQQSYSPKFTEEEEEQWHNVEGKHRASVVLNSVHTAPLALCVPFFSCVTSHLSFH